MVPVHTMWSTTCYFILSLGLPTPMKPYVAVLCLSLLVLLTLTNPTTLEVSLADKI